MAKTQATYMIGSLETPASKLYWSKVYDGTAIEGNSIIWDGIKAGDTKRYQITQDSQLHVGTLNPVFDTGYPIILRNGKDVTDEYEFTQIETTFEITARDITLQSANLTKEYDGTALVAGGDITDTTAGLADKGYVSGEEFTYTFTGSQLFVGSSDNSFDVGNSDTALTTDYSVTKQYGTLTVTGRTAPLTITVTDQTKTYDGQATIDTTAYSITGELAYGDTITVTLSNSNINAGTYTDGITATYKIMHDNGDGTKTDVTDMYLNVTVDNGDLNITKRDVTIKSADATKAYDGTALTDHNTSVTSGSFVAGEGYVANVTGSQTEEGSSPNYFTVSAADGTNMNNYNVTKIEGTLTVTGFGDLTITAADATRMYDGTALTSSGYTYTGLEAGHTITATTAGTQTHFGTTANTITSYTVLDANGNDVTAAYNSITTVDGTLSITKRDATLTSGSATKKYDGLPLTEETVTVTGSGFVTGEGATYYNFASRTAVGSAANEFNYVLNNGTFTDDYAISTVNGTLTVTQNDTLITITADSDSKMYDGSALTDSGYTVTGALATGDYFASVTVSGSITDAGTTANTVTGYTILNQAGDDVTSFYSNIQTVDGELEVTKRSVTLTSDSATKPYDGTPLTNSTVLVTGDGWAAGENATYSNFASITNVGTTANTFTYTLNDNTKADNYTIETAEGTLEITPRDVTITIGVSLTTGLTYLYDNTATKVLTEGQYVVSGLAAGESLANVTITTDSSNAGIYDENMYTVTYDIVNASGVSTKSNYNVTLNKNDVEITKRTITIEAGSDSKVYDGTALTCSDYEVVEGATAEYQLLAGEGVEGVVFTADSTITHAGSTANKIDASNVTIKKADGSDSSMNYNIETEDGTLTVTQRGVLLQSTSAEKFYDGTALQNRQVVVTGFHYDSTGKVVVDENAGFLAGDGCTYDFVNDNVVIDKDGNVIAWVVSEQSDTAYGQTEVGTSKNEFNYNNFTSVKYGSYESDYIIIYGANQESLGLSKDDQDLFGDLTVWGGPVAINMTDYSWTYDYQAKTNGYFDDGYTVVVTTNEAGTETETTEVAHNSEGSAIALLGRDTIVVTVTGEDGSAESGKVQHVGTDKQNEASYAIYRNGVDVTEEVEEYYQISIDGGLLQITPRTVYITSASDSKEYDGEALTNNTVIEGSEGRDTGFIFGEGAAYTVTGSQTEVGASANSFAIEKLLTDTKAADYKFVLTEGTLTVNGEGTEVLSTTAGDFKKYGCAFQVLANGQGLLRSAMTSTLVEGTLENVNNWKIVGTGDFNGSGKDGLLWLEISTGDLVMQNDMTSFAEVNNKTNVLGTVAAGYTAKATGDFSGNGLDGALIQTPETGDIEVSTTRGLACFAREENGDMFVGWLGALVNTWDDGVALKGDLTDPGSINANNYRYEVVAVGDFNGDGRDDVMLQNTMPTAVTEDGVEYNITGSGDVFTFLTGSEDAIKRGDAPTVCYAGKATDGWEILGVGDFDSDGDADVLLGLENSDGTTTLVGWSMKNGVQEEAFGLGTMNTNQEFKGIADFNNDGTDDLLISTGDERLDAWTIKNATVTGSLAIV